MASPDVYPPLLAVDATHHGAWVVIVAAIGLTMTFACLLIRVYVRVSISPAFGVDDIVLLAAMACALAQNGVTFGAISNGFGNSIELIEPGDLRNIQKMLFSGDILYLVILYLTKCCIVTVFLRLTPIKVHNAATWVALAFSTMWMFSSILMIAINCALTMPWQSVPEKCPSLFLRWQIITAFDIVTEACLFFLAIFLLMGLQMATQRKLIVLSTFGSRLPLIIFAGMRLRALKHGLHSSNPPMGLVETAVWTQIGLHFSIVACTSFCLKPFMAAVSTNYGVASGTQSGDTSRDPNGYAKKSGYALDKSGHAGGSFALKSFGSKTATRLRSFVGSDDDEERDGMRVGGSMFRGDGVKNQAMVTKARRAGSSSIGSSGSTKMIIKKDVAYTVQYGPRGDNGGWEHPADHDDHTPHGSYQL